MSIKSYKELKKELQSVGCLTPNGAFCYYRGLPNENWLLTPSLFYQAAKFSPDQTEKKVLQDFINQSGIVTKASGHNSVWIKACLGRHCGLKLRLMDWTIDISVALKFMISKDNLPDNAALFVHLKHESLKPNFDIYSTSYFSVEKTFMLNPPLFAEHYNLIGHKNRFIQNGKFLVQDYDSSHNCYYEKNKEYVHKIIIPQENLMKIYKECCDELNLDSDVPIYLEDTITSLCREINEKY